MSECETEGFLMKKEMNFMELTYEEHKIWGADDAGKVVAEIDFPAVGDGIVDIEHTFVDESLRGQKMAGKLVQGAVETIRKNGWKTKTSCSYAATWFKRHEEDVKDIKA